MKTSSFAPHYALRSLLPSQAVLLYPIKKTLAWKAVGELKYITFTNYAAMYPEYDYVFCGDDGQGDLIAGELMMER